MQNLCYRKRKCGMSPGSLLGLGFPVDTDILFAYFFPYSESVNNSNISDVSAFSRKNNRMLSRRLDSYIIHLMLLKGNDTSIVYKGFAYTKVPQLIYTIFLNCKHGKG